MKIFDTYKKLFFRFPAVRIGTFLSVAVLGILLYSIIDKTVKKIPEIKEISPQIGAPGDELVISGSGFGTSRGTSYVEISGSKITSSNYRIWRDHEIRLVLPDNVQDGLVIVGTSEGRSEPAFFANEVNIPVAVKLDPVISVPKIASVSPEKVVVGQHIIITGSNFGSTRENSTVYFTANRNGDGYAGGGEKGLQSGQEGNQSDIYIAANVQDRDYVSWSDTEIIIQVPDGADSGSVFVETSKGTSTSKKITVSYPVGKKQYSARRTYVVQSFADISNYSASKDSTIMLYVPKPVVTSFQPYAQLNEIFPDPFIPDDADNMIYKVSMSKNSSAKQRFSQTYIVSSYAVKSNIKAEAVSPYKRNNSALYTIATRKDELVPAADPAVITLMKKICGAEKNPYKKARMIYDYFLHEYKLSSKIRSGDVSVIDLIRKKKGDAYDFAILYAAVCRAAGIPALPVSGILVQEKDVSSAHWWCEIYFEDYGWFPVDVALAAGLEFKNFSYIGDVKEFYFGNLDNQHIAFSRGWKQIRQSGVNSKTVYRPRTYAFQSIWEEAGDATSSYSSLWNNPVVLGIY